MTDNRPKILAIDDTPANLMTLGAALAADFDLQTATSGVMGIALATQSPPDLILLDVMMPGMDGFEVCQRLKTIPALKDVPVVFVTAMSELESEVMGLTLGAADYITKPIKVDIARQRIRNLLERESLRKQVIKQRDQLVMEVAQRIKTEEELRKLSIAVEQSPASVVITDLAANIEYVNPRFTEVTGYSPKEVMGENPHVLASGQTPRETILTMWSMLTRGAAWHGELINKRKSGELYWEESFIAPVKDPAGRVTHYVAVKTDITQRKQLEAQREEALSRLQKIASRVPGMVYQYLLRPDGSSCFPFASDAIRQIYRVTPEQVQTDASRVFAVLHPDDHDDVQASIQISARHLSEWRQEYRVKFDDGTVRWLFGNALPQLEADGAVLWHGYIADVTERKLSEALFRGLFEQSVFLAGILDPKGRIIDVNSMALHFAQTPREALIGQYFPDTPWWHNPAERAKLIACLSCAYAGQATSFEASHASGSSLEGDRIDVLFNAMPIFTDDGIQVAVVGVDITQRKRAEAALHESDQRFRYLFEKNASVMLLIEPASGHIIDANLSAVAYYGYARDQLVGMPIGRINTLAPDLLAEEWARASSEQRNYFLFTHRLASGEERQVEVYSTPIESHGRSVLFSIVHDVTARKLLEDQVRQLAFSDALTQLPNRRLLNDRLHQALVACKRSSGHGALMFLDLDNFKPLNDAHGHDVGDALLQEVARRLQACVREADTVARFGGDEFVLVLGNLSADSTESRAFAQAVAEKIRLALAQPYFLTAIHAIQAGTLIEHHCTASIGVAIFSSQHSDPESILSWADAAMYQAKQAGRNIIRFFDPPRR